MLHVVHELLALERQQLLDGAFVDLLLKSIADNSVELADAGFFIQTHISDIGLWVGNPPADIPIDDHTLLFCSEHGFVVWAVQCEQTFVNVLDVLQRGWELKVKTGFGDHFLDLTQRIDHAKLALVNDKK